MKKADSPAYALFREIVDRRLAPILASQGFKQVEKDGSDWFQRQVDDASQSLICDMQWDWHHEVGKWDLYVHSHYPSLLKILRANGYRREGNGNEPGIGGHVMNVFRPSKGLDWLLFDAETDVDHLYQAVLAGIESGILPFLAKYTRIKEIRRHWEKGTRAALFGWGFSEVFLCAAYVGEGRLEEAIGYLERVLTGADPRSPRVESRERGDLKALLKSLKQHAVRKPKRDGAGGKVV